ncbi:MAG TPA: hypothetical protein VFA10_04945 [Ktedonobacteraceae bacterium]|nr:hypothetical protein [Ktedonobacteraceae bacterium]
MTTQQVPNPEEPDGRPLSQQLEDLSKELGFYLEESHPAPGSSLEEGLVALRIATIYHKADVRLWRQLYRHLELLGVPGGQIEWFSVRLAPETGDTHTEHYREQLKQIHLVLLLVSIDLVETLLKKCPDLYQALADLGEGTVVFPVRLCPVFWTCAFPTLEPTPSRAISLWKNQDAAHAVVAEKLSGVLEGIKLYLEENGDTQN